MGLDNVFYRLGLGRSTQLQTIQDGGKLRFRDWPSGAVLQHAPQKEDHPGEPENPEGPPLRMAQHRRQPVAGQEQDAAQADAGRQGRHA